MGLEFGVYEFLGIIKLIVYKRVFFKGYIEIYEIINSGIGVI